MNKGLLKGIIISFICLIFIALMILTAVPKEKGGFKKIDVQMSTNQVISEEIEEDITQELKSENFIIEESIIEELTSEESIIEEVIIDEPINENPIPIIEEPITEEVTKEELIVDKTKGYESIVFSDFVHHIDIRISDSNLTTMFENALEEEYYTCDVNLDGILFDNVGIRTKGNSSLEAIYRNPNTNRYSFKLKFDKYNKEQTCYGLDELNLNNVLADATYMKEYLAYDMFEYMGVITPLSTFVNITINGEPWGLYIGVEGVDDSFIERNFNTVGKMYKPEAYSLRNDAQLDSDLGTDGVVGEEKDKYIQSLKNNAETLIYVDDDYNNYINLFDTAKSDINEEDKIRLINSLKVLNSGENLKTIMDIDNTLKLFVVNNFICNFDSYLGPRAHNFYLYEEDGFITMIPWDLNLAFASKPHYSIKENVSPSMESTIMLNMPYDLPLLPSDIGLRPFIEKPLGVYENKLLYDKYMNEFIEGYFDSGYFDKKYNDIVEMIYPYIEKDVTCFYYLEEIEQGQKVLKELIRLRLQSVKGQLNGTINIEDKSSYIDCSHIELMDTGHQRGGFVPTKGK